MDEYKHNRICLGRSDIASLVLRSPCDVRLLNFGEDDAYYAWFVKNEGVEIPSHYHEVYRCQHWLKIYDDEMKTVDIEAETIVVYEAGMRGCLIVAENLQHIDAVHMLDIEYK